MTQLTIENVKQKFDIWRKKKKGVKTPKYLIDDVKELSKYCNVHTLFKELNIKSDNKSGREIIKFQKKYLNSLDINILKSSRINYKYPEILKKEILSQLKKGMKISELAKKFNMPESTIYNWVKEIEYKKYKNKLNLQLLQKIYNIFEINKIIRISTLDLISHLCKDPLWSNYNPTRKNNNICPVQLSSHLITYNIHSKKILLGYNGKLIIQKRGYEKSQFEDIWKTYNISKNNDLNFHTEINDHCLVPSLELFPKSVIEDDYLSLSSPKEVITSTSSKNLNLKDFKEYLQKFDNVTYKNGVFYINNMKEQNKVTTLKEKNLPTKSKEKSPDPDNYIFITKFICSLIISLFFFKLSYFEMLSIFSLSYGFFSIIEYFILDNFHKNSKKDLNP